MPPSSLIHHNSSRSVHGSNLFTILFCLPIPSYHKLIGTCSDKIAWALTVTDHKPAWIDPFQNPAVASSSPIKIVCDACRSAGQPLEILQAIHQIETA